MAAGVPIGTPAFVRERALAVLHEHEACHLRVRVLRCTQTAYLLLRYSLGVRFVFLHFCWAAWGPFYVMLAMPTRPYTCMT